MRFLIANPTASLYNNRTQIVAALAVQSVAVGPDVWTTALAVAAVGAEAGNAGREAGLLALLAGAAPRRAPLRIDVLAELAARLAAAE